MIDIFALPYQYIVDIGLGESAMLLYLVKMVSSSDKIVGQYLINKKQMRENNLINFIEENNFDTLVDKLYNFGFIHFHRKANRKTRSVSVSVVNMIMYELLGKEQYLLNLEDYETKKMCGRIIPYNSIDSLSFNFPEYKSMTSKNYYISYSCDIKDVIEQIKNMYFVNIQKIKDNVVDGKFVPPKKNSSNLPVNVYSFFMNGNKTIEANLPLYYGFLYGMDIKINTDIDVGDVDNEEDEPTLKELARNDYGKFCEYLCIGQTMKKPILSWNSKDFVSYIYCGLAKLRENDGDFVFPDFSKDCARMKKLMDKYGNKRLNKVIYTMVKNTDDMAEYCKFNNFKPTPSILSVDWMFDKMLDYVSHIENERISDSLSQVIQQNTKIDNSIKEDSLKKEDNSVKLNELRETFNKNKETK